MKIRYFLLILTGLIGWIGCSDEETLTPSDDPKYELSIPQGDHDYDNRIVKWFDRTGVYILYKFDPADVYFSVDNNWLESYQDTTVNPVTYLLGDQVVVENDTLYIKFNGYIQMKFAVGITYDANGLRQTVTIEGNKAIVEKQNLRYGGTITVDEALETYAGKQLAWIEEMFLNFYPDNILRSNMVLKLILGRNLKNQSTKILYYQAFNSLIVSYGDETLDALTLTEKNTHKINLNTWFMRNQLLDKISFDKFFEVTTYDWVGGTSPNPRPTSATFYERGLINLPYNTALDATQNADLNAFLSLIMGNPYEKLIQEPENGNYHATDFTGILHPKKDVNGLLLKKYTILVDELKRIGVDMKAIGNLYN